MRADPYLLQLEDSGVIKREATLKLEDGRVQGYYWRDSNPRPAA